ncbi:MAG: DNA recombination/repair protein RecA, partial [bacterium]|nr:DNA recombination/repair protein RecA [bacterium]
NEGISYFGDILNAGIKSEIIKKAGSWFQFEETQLGQGVEASKEFLRANPEIAKRIKDSLLGSEREES